MFQVRIHGRGGQGVVTAAEMLSRFRFDSSDLAYLSKLTGNDGKRLFDPAFLEHISRMDLK